MCKQLMVILLLLSLGLCPAVSKADIVWIGENDDENGDGTPDDLQWVTWLREQGYTVDDSERGNWTTMDAAKLAVLNQAELIIVSRNTDSTDYIQGQEAAQWNSITTPIILMTPYLSRANRWGWVNHDGLNIVPGSPGWSVEVPEHAIFFNVALGPNNTVSALDGALSPSNGIAHLSGDTGNGTLLATASSGEAAIVEWEPGTNYFDGGAAVASRRLLFCTGTTEGGGNPQGGFNITETGQQLYLNAINYLLGRDLSAASGPVPGDGSDDVSRDVTLSWTPGPIAVSHDVYFGASMDDVSNADRSNPLGVLLSQGHAGNSYTPQGALAFGQRYYWRIDAVDPAPGSEIHRGSVWSLTIEPFSIPIPADRVTATASSSGTAATGPEKTIDGSGLTGDLHSADALSMWLSALGDAAPWIQYSFDRPYPLDRMLVWNANQFSEPAIGWGLKDVVVETSLDGDTWSAVEGVTQLTRAPGADGYAPGDVVDLTGIVAQHVRIVIQSNWGGILQQYGLSEVRFYSLPVYARSPDPSSGAVDVPQGSTLRWRAGRQAQSHELYLGSSAEDLALVATTGEAQATPVTMLEETYFWRVTEVNEAENPAAWESDTWSFSVANHTVVDDFEGYLTEDADDPTAIFNVWVDGFSDNGNGSQVGHSVSPFAEQIVAQGDQSMPLYYGQGGAAVSEATRTFDTAQNWVEGGATTLSLLFSGNPDNAAGQLYVTVNGTRIDFEGAAEAFTRPVWTRWNIDLAALGGAAAGVRSLTIGVSSSGSGLFFVDDIRLYRTPPALPTEEIWIEAEAADTVTNPLEIADLSTASGGQYLSVLPGNNSMTAPPATGIATYHFTVQGGTYRLLARAIVPTADDNSCWLRIPDATTQTANNASGWILWFDIAGGSSWHVDEVRSNDDGGAVVQFTLPAGQHTLEVAYREDGLQLDAFLLTDLLD